MSHWKDHAYRMNNQKTLQHKELLLGEAAQVSDAAVDKLRIEGIATKRNLY